jgi:hypothetical protein
MTLVVGPPSSAAASKRARFVIYTSSEQSNVTSQPTNAMATLLHPTGTTAPALNATTAGAQMLQAPALALAARQRHTCPVRPAFQVLHVYLLAALTMVMMFSSAAIMPGPRHVRMWPSAANSARPTNGPLATSQPPRWHMREPLLHWHHAEVQSNRYQAQPVLPPALMQWHRAPPGDALLPAAVVPLPSFPTLNGAPIEYGALSGMGTSPLTWAAWVRAGRGGAMWQPGALAMLAAWEVVGDQGGQFRFTILEGHLAVWTSWTNDVPVSASPRDGNGYRPQLMTRQRLDPSVWSESWTHVALVRNGLQLTAYVNGSVALDGRARTHFDHRTHVPLRVGCHPSGGGVFDGEIRGVVAGHVALTALEVRSLAAALSA